MSSITLDAATVDALAEAVVARLDLDALADLIADRLRDSDHVPADKRTLVGAAALARELGVSRPFVYEHADRLGAVRLGDGPRARLRFDVARARAALGAGASPPPDHHPEPTTTPRPRRRSRARNRHVLTPR